MNNATDTANRLSHLLFIGTILSVDTEQATCRVQAGDLLTTDIPWLVPCTGQTLVWNPPSPNEVVLVACPEGDTERAIAIRGLYSNPFPAPKHRADTLYMRLSDGAELEYNTSTHALTATLVNHGTVRIQAAGGVTIDGPLTVNGDTSLNGNASIQHTLTASDDVFAGHISLKNHIHPGVQSGGGTTGTPR